MTTALPIEAALHVAAIGVVATALLDLWALLLKAIGVPVLDMALVGRWVGHMRRGVWSHERIAAAPPVWGERALGWAVHYAVGIAFAGLLVAIAGVDWLQRPRPLPALAVGAATVLVPWLVMQPAMGAGIASSKTPQPMQNRLRSLANHVVFGVGMYLAAVAIARLPLTPAAAST